MSVRQPRALPAGGGRLRAVLAAGVTAGVVMKEQQSVEYDVLDSSGARFGSAIVTTEGPSFVTPVEMRGVLVRAPFAMCHTPNSRQLATNLAEVLSSALAG